MEPPALPFVDTHSVRVRAPIAVVWDALESYVDNSLRRAERQPITRVLGTRPRAGFRVVERKPPAVLLLAGRHRFSTYQLSFELEACGPHVTELRATTHAAFPGLHGRIYRALVIGSRGHVLGVRHMLRAVERRSIGGR